MANTASISIKFLDYSLATIGEDIDVSFHTVSPSGFDSVTMRVANTTYISGGISYFAIGTTNEQCAANFIQAFNNAYGEAGSIRPLPFSAALLAPSLDEVEIVCTEYSTSGNIDYFEAIVPTLPWYQTTEGAESLPTATISIDSITYSESGSGSPCTIAKRTINVSDAIFPVTITAPVTKVCADQSELYFDYIRAWSGTISVQDNGSYTDSISSAYVEAIFAITPQVSYISGSANVNIGVSVISDDELLESITKEYSLDNIVWQTGNTFFGLFTGSYTAYVRDQFGCTKSEPFEVDVIPDAEKPEPYFDIVDNQSFQFRPVSTFDQITTFPNYFNALYEDQQYSNITLNNYCQKFCDVDSVKVQILGTYETINIVVRDIEGNEVISYPTSIAKQYIGLKDMRDCFVSNGGGTTSQIYYTAGNLYDYDTGLVIGDGFNLSKRLEPWMENVNNIQNIQIVDSLTMDGQYEVSDTTFNKTTKATSLIMPASYLGGENDEEAKSKIIYNAEAWNVNEATIPMAALGAGHYYLTVEATDTDIRYDNVIWRSQPFEVAVKHEKTVLITWTATKVIGGLDFSTGITHMVRVEGQFDEYGAETEKEVMETDSGNIVPLKSTKQQTLTFKSHAIPPYLVSKIQTALSQHDTVYVNNLKIQTVEFGEAEPIDQNSMQTMTATCYSEKTVIYEDENGVISSATGYQVLGTSDEKVLGV